MKTLVKYRGGKRREISQFKRFIPQKYGRYLEPFLGGGAVFFELEPEQAIINDINAGLMKFYEQVRNNYTELSEQLSKLQEIYEKNQAAYKLAKKMHPNDRVENLNENLYYQIRKMYNGLEPTNYLFGTLYYFINKTAYSGMIRYNGRGEYNVPFGRYVNFNTKLITPVHSELLQRAQLYNTDFTNIFNLAEEKDFIFIDPPYDCTFHDYGNLDMENGFDEQQHRRLANEFKNLHCRAMMVIGRTPLTEELYGDQIRYEYAKNYSVNIRNRFHATASHIVVTNYKV